VRALDQRCKRAHRPPRGQHCGGELHLWFRKGIGRLAHRAFNQHPFVTPAKAGAQTEQTDDVAARRLHFLRWVPAFAGMTIQV
jgi:murein endopeptidase